MMFAFAIYDLKENFVSREDRAGKTSLYYKNNGTFNFASELKALMVDPNVSLSVDSYLLIVIWLWVLSPEIIVF